jgi:hypothetical protein
MAAERLLAEHVLAHLERADRPVDVHGVRQRDVDGLDLRVREQLLVAAVRPLDPSLPRVGLRAADVATRHRDDIEVGGRLGARQELVVDVRRGEEAPPDRAVYPHDGSATGLKAVSRMR